MFSSLILITKVVATLHHMNNLRIGKKKDYLDIVELEVSNFRFLVMAPFGLLQ